MTSAAVITKSAEARGIVRANFPQGEGNEATDAPRAHLENLAVDALRENFVVARSARCATATLTMTDGTPQGRAMARIIVFGASGNCGRLFVERAREHGHTVTAIARTRLSDLPEGVSLVVGDVLDPTFVAEAVRGHDIVVSALGMRYAHPWAARRSPDDFAERATRNIVEAMKTAGVDRLVVISAAGVGDSHAALNWPMRVMLKTSNVGVAYADLERMESVLSESGLDWHAVRPTTLTHGERTGRAHPTDAFRVTSTISRADVAEWLLHEVEAPPRSAKAGVRTPMITVT